jgi:hypothetical protein
LPLTALDESFETNPISKSRPAGIQGADYAKLEIGM